MKRKDNPIVATAKLGLELGLREGGQQLFVIPGKWDELRPEVRHDILRRLFTDEAIHEIGCLIAGALVAGDKQMAPMVRDAIKKADHMFSRDREKELLIPALRFRLLHWEEILERNRGHSQRAIEEFKNSFEQHCKINGWPLAQYQWSRLRRALMLPKRSCVRPDRKPVKLGKVSEIIDFAPQIKNNKEPQRRKREATEAYYRKHYSINKSLQGLARTQILLDMIARGEFGDKKRTRRRSSTKRPKTVS